MTAFTELAGIELPIVQAGMGGGVARHRLAAAVSEAGGLGTLGILDPPRLAEELAAARRLTDRPLAVNLLLPFARRAHWEVAREADVVVTFWGRPRRRTDGRWVHQCGSVEEALAAHVAGADAVIAQGVEAGGHVRGLVPAMSLLDAIKGALPRDFPVLVAGGIATAYDVRRALEGRADAAVLGTRFVLSEESGAQDGYRRRLVEASDTVLTELFGAGWPRAPHRVVGNEATRRWLRSGRRGPAWIRAVNTLGGPVVARLPASVQDRAVAAQTARSPLLSPQPPVEGSPEALLDAGPLYAGESVARIDAVRPAAELTRGLVP
ncbi:MAG: NAD(P)H-dependent flavin oxidoreductase [Solirubrobacterales bacterium]